MQNSFNSARFSNTGQTIDPARHAKWQADKQKSIGIYFANLGTRFRLKGDIKDLERFREKWKFLPDIQPSSLMAIRILYRFASHLEKNEKGQPLAKQCIDHMRNNFGNWEKFCGPLEDRSDIRNLRDLLWALQTLSVKPSSQFLDMVEDFMKKKFPHEQTMFKTLDTIKSLNKTKIDAPSPGLHGAAA